MLWQLGQSERQVAQRGHDVGAVSPLVLGDARGIFTQRDIAPVMRAVFDRGPVAVAKGTQPKHVVRVPRRPSVVTFQPPSRIMTDWAWNGGERELTLPAFETHQVAVIQPRFAH